MSHFYIVLFYKVHTAKHIFAVLLALLVGMWLTLTHAIGILLYVTGPAKINHVSANYTMLHIHEYLQFYKEYFYSVSFKRSPIKFCICGKTFSLLV